MNEVDVVLKNIIKGDILFVITKVVENFTTNILYL